MPKKYGYKSGGRIGLKEGGRGTYGGWPKGGPSKPKDPKKPRPRPLPSPEPRPRPDKIWPGRGSTGRRLPVGAEGIFGLGVKGKPHSSPEGRKATMKLARKRLRDRGGKTLRDKLKDLYKNKVPNPRRKPGPTKPIDPRSPYIKDRVMTPLRAKHALGTLVKKGISKLLKPKGVLKPKTKPKGKGLGSGIKPSEMHEIIPKKDRKLYLEVFNKRGKKAKGGRIGLKGGSTAQSHYLQHGYGPHKIQLRSGKPKLAKKGW